ncbi:hypothetical protein [Roseibium album]|uniref:GumK N-terminal domain-containing glycosyltransferase n=1 Tax=Roseibium album TaxID=311410 RepID=UPI00249329AC|nr:hypothetical protein [Roseibium album]
MPEEILLVSRHDYRTGWRANLHFLADAYRDLGCNVRFVSTGFSPLSLLSTDHRKGLVWAGNTWQNINGVDCYLWRSIIHPFGKGLGNLKSLTSGLFKWWINSTCNALNDAAASADVVIVESGISASLVGRIRRSAPKAKIIYLVSDLLETVGAHPFIEEQLFRDRDAISHIVVVARAMAAHFEPYHRPVHFIPHGLSKSEFDNIGPSPYSAGRNVVTVGSMLFDPGFFHVGARSFPDVQFHLIGTPQMEEKPENVTEYGRMPFDQTLPFLKHADAGIAPYHDQDHAEYLSDSSMKLMQYDYLQLPAICPDFAAGGNVNRHGYRPGNEPSIRTAIENALQTPFKSNTTEMLDWKDVATRYIEL